MSKRERELQTAISRWLLHRHPGIMFCNMPDQVHKTWHMQDHHSYPDMAIYQPAGKWHGLFLEIKASRSTIFRKDGKFKKSEHLQKQINCMKKLLDRKYFTAFVWDLDQGIEVIEKYLKNGSYNGG